MRPAAVIIAALFLIGAAAPHGHAQEEATTVELSGRTFRAIEVAVKELGRHMDVPIEGYNIAVTESNDRIFVHFLDPESHGTGSGPNLKGFTVEMRADSLKVTRAHFHK
jgi:hypothetical protein